MHIKTQTATELFDNWDLKTGDKSDIISALEEAFMQGAANGSLDSSIATEAMGEALKASFEDDHIFEW